MEYDKLRKDEFPKKVSNTFEGNLNFLELTDLIYVLLETVWGEDWGIFTMESPKTIDPKNITFPTITFQLKEQKPGIVGNNELRELKPRLRGEYKQTNNVTKEVRIITEYAQRVDADIQFSIFGETNLEAIRLSESFMNFIYQYTGILQKEGIQNIWFQSEEADDDSPRDSVYVRRINYRVTFEKVYPVVKDKIEDVKVKAELIMKELKKDEKLPSQEEKHKEDYK